jgi:hypothetical protein
MKWLELFRGESTNYFFRFTGERFYYWLYIGEIIFEDTLYMGIIGASNEPGFAFP